MSVLLTFSMSVFLSILWNNNTYPYGVSIVVKYLFLDNINHSINVNYHYYMQILILLLVTHWITLHLYFNCPSYVSFSISTLFTRPMNITMNIPRHQFFLIIFQFVYVCLMCEQYINICMCKWLCLYLHRVRSQRRVFGSLSSSSSLCSFSMRGSGWVESSHLGMGV